MILDPDLIQFTTQFLEKNGALVDAHPDHIHALLPGHLADSLNLPEETRLGSNEHPLLYGSPVLDRLVHAATSRIPVTYGTLSIPYIKKAGFDAAIAQDLSFINAKCEVGVRAETRTSYMIITCSYVALSDERKEGLTRLTFHEPSGAVVEDFEDTVTDFECSYYRKGNLPPQFSTRIGLTLQKAIFHPNRIDTSKGTEIDSSFHRTGPGPVYRQHAQKTSSGCPQHTRVLSVAGR